MLRSLFLSSVLVSCLFSVIACSSDESNKKDGAKDVGAEDGPCYDDGTCDAELQCVSELCVGSGDGDGVVGTGGASGDGPSTGGTSMGGGSGGNADGTGGLVGPAINWNFDAGTDQWKNEDSDNDSAPLVVTGGKMCISADPGPNAVSWLDDGNSALAIPLTPGKSYRFSASWDLGPALAGNFTWTGLCTDAESTPHFSHSIDEAEAFGSSSVYEFEAQCATFGILVQNDTDGILCFDDLKLEEIE